MIKQSIKAVIGKNFGDEGKGLTVDYLCSKTENNLVIKHNGGAQAGHTVDLPDVRFVFHQLSSGSFRGADTFWSNTYYPDLYKLNEEINKYAENILGNEYKQSNWAIPACLGENSGNSGKCFNIYSQADTPIVVIYDVLFNMALEISRGEDRHGSCGMGIYEAYLRTQAGFGITMGTVMEEGHAGLVARMSDIRNNYYLPKFKQLICDKKLSDENGRIKEILELINEEGILDTVAEEMILAAGNVNVLKDEEVPSLLKKYDQVVFETGQGLLLDADREEYWPNVTGSNTGLTNVISFLNNYELKLDEVCYVTRSYVTRHGAGRLPGECQVDELLEGLYSRDITNVFNEWQGNIRYAKHINLKQFWKPVVNDYELADKLLNGEDDDMPELKMFLTHLNETNDQIVFIDKKMSIRNFVDESRETIGDCINNREKNNILCNINLTAIYTSATPFSKDICETIVT